MYQIPAHIWNQIAHEETLKSLFAQKRFPLDPEQLEQQLEKDAKALQEEGYEGRIIAACQQVLPLLLEHKAIYDFLGRNNYYDLMPAFPEVTTVDEAVQLMNMDTNWNMSKNEKDSLTKLLISELKKNLPENGMSKFEDIEGMDELIEDFRAAKKK